MLPQQEIECPSSVSSHCSDHQGGMQVHCDMFELHAIITGSQPPRSWYFCRVGAALGAGQAAGEPLQSPYLLSAHAHQHAASIPSTQSTCCFVKYIASLILRDGLKGHAPG